MPIIIPGITLDDLTIEQLVFAYEGGVLRMTISYAILTTTDEVHQRKRVTVDAPPGFQALVANLA